ncbi:hypothetical protein DIRU0_E04148 [Diutina rugosa]
MEYLLFDRKIKKLRPAEFATGYIEASYTCLQQFHPFPPKRQTIAAVNSLSLERQQHRFLLSGCADSSIKLWDVTDPVEPGALSCLASINRRSVHRFGISSLSWWPHDSGMFISGSFDHTVKIWDTNELNPVHTFPINHRVFSLDIADKGDNLVAVGSDQPFIQLLDVRGASSAHTLTGHKGKTIAVKWHPQIPYILATGGYDGEVKIWDIRRAKSCLCRLDMLQTNTGDGKGNNLSRQSVKAHSGPVNGVVWNDLGTELYTAANDDRVRVWDNTTHQPPPVNKLINFGPLTRNKFPQVIPLVVTPNMESEVSHLLFPSDTGDVFVFRTIDGKIVNRLPRHAEKQGRVSSMIYGSPFSAHIYCGTIDGEIVTWRPDFT